MAEKNRFTVIDNKKFTEKISQSRQRNSYFTNPINSYGQSLREQYVRFANEDNDKWRFKPSDLLNW